MNLAEIRKKAQKGAPAEQAAAPTPAAGASNEAPQAPEASQAQQGSQTAQAPQASQARQASQAPAQGSELEPEGFEWQSEYGDDLLPASYALSSVPERFDPAAVILQGRDTAELGGEVSNGEEAGAATLELLCFRVANEEYAISIMDIKEIIKPREVTEVPRVPSFVRGILSLRGIIIPIFDIRVRLGLPDATSTERERVVVVSRQSGFCGVLVDEVVQVVRIPEAGIEPPPVVLEGIDRDFVQGIGRVGGRMLILLDIEKVLDVSLL